MVARTCFALGALALVACGSSSPSSSAGATGSSNAGSSTGASSAGGSGSAGASGVAGSSGATAGVATAGAAGPSGTQAGAGSTTGSGSSGSGSTASGAAASGGSGAGDGGTTSGATDSGPGAPNDGGGVRLDGGTLLDGTIFYVALDDGTLHAYRQGTWEEIASWSGLPVKDGVRGSDADPATGILYLTHGGAGPEPGHGAPSATGGLVAWSLLTNRVVFNVAFTHGVDQPSVGLGVIYVPAGEFDPGNLWYYVSATDGSPIGTEPGGKSPHDTIFRNSHRYYGGTQDTFLYVLGLPITKVGPSPSPMAGVRPFTINAAETRAYITWTDFRGFSVGDLTTGQIIKSFNFGAPCQPYAPSHGITLSPDGSEVYVLDMCVNQVRVYDSSDNPMLKATITLAHNLFPQTNEQPCAWDCLKDGWLLHSRNGKYVYVGNAGDIIDTATRMPAAYLPALANSRHGFLEMIWSKGTITGTSTHVGLGY